MLNILPKSSYLDRTITCRTGRFVSDTQPQDLKWKRYRPQIHLAELSLLVTLPTSREKNEMSSWGYRAARSQHR